MPLYRKVHAYYLDFILGDLFPGILRLFNKIEIKIELNNSSLFKLTMRVYKLDTYTQVLISSARVIKPGHKTDWQIQVACQTPGARPPGTIAIPVDCINI